MGTQGTINSHTNQYHTDNMTIQINTTEKTITITESDLTFGDLIKQLNKILPEWKEYKLVQTIQYITNPVYIPYQQYHYDLQPIVTTPEPYWTTTNGTTSHYSN